MEEKLYYVVKNSGVMNIVVGCFAVAVGISALVSGIKLMSSSTDILF